MLETRARCAASRFLYGPNDILRHSALPEDKKKMAAITQIIANQLKLE